MTWTAAFQLCTAIIVSLGGGSVIVFGLSSYLGKLWADRALEKERHKYTDMLQTAKNELDRATNRYQVQLDALAHIHKLRTDEEFLHLGKLWRYMAVLKDCFNAAAGLGLMLVPADPDEAKKYRAMLRTKYENALYEAREYFLQEKLFIPANIAECAEVTLGQAIKEKNFYDVFSDHPESGVRIESV